MRTSCSQGVYHNPSFDLIQRNSNIKKDCDIMSKVRCFCRYRNSQRVNQPVQDDSSSSGRALLHLIPENFCLVWEKGERGWGEKEG